MISLNAELACGTQCFINGAYCFYPTQSHCSLPPPSSLLEQRRMDLALSCLVVGHTQSFRINHLSSPLYFILRFFFAQISDLKHESWPDFPTVLDD